MGQWLLRIFGLMAFLIVEGTAAMAGGVPWSSDVAGAQAQAQQSNKLIMVDFYTDWCEWCHRADSEVYTKPAVMDAASAFVPLKLNAEKSGKALAVRFSISSLPTLLFLDSSGAFVDKIEGYTPADTLAPALARIAQSSQEFPLFQAQVKANSKDMVAVAKLAAALIYRMRVEEAQQLISAAEGQQNGDLELLAPAYDKMGDYNISQVRIKLALPWYQKALAVTRDPLQLSGFHLKLGLCYGLDGQTTEAQNELQAASDTPGAPDEVKKVAAELIRKFKKKR